MGTGNWQEICRAVHGRCRTTKLGDGVRSRRDKSWCVLRFVCKRFLFFAIVGFGRWNRPPKIPSQVFPKLSLSGYRTFGIPFGKGRRCGAVMTVHLQQCTPPEFFTTCCKEYLLKAIVIYAEQVHMTRHFAK